MPYTGGYIRSAQGLSAGVSSPPLWRPPSLARVSLIPPAFRSDTSTAYAQAILADSPAGFWRLGEPNAMFQCFDSGPNANHGSYIGKPSLGNAGALTGDPDTSALFTGVGADAGLIPDAATLDFANIFTIELWLKWVAGASGYPLTKGNQFLVRVQSNQISLDNDDVGIAFTSAGAATTDGLFHQWFIVHNGTGSGNTFIMKDGVVQAITEDAPTLSFSTNAVALNIGRYYTGSVGWTGGIDEVSVWGSALSSAQGLTHYNAGAGISASEDVAPFLGGGYYGY